MKMPGRPFSSRRGIELSINTIVVVVLGVIILGAGIMMLFKIAKQSEEFIGDVSEAQKQQLEEKMLAGETFLVADNVREAESDKGEVYAIGLKNKLTRTSEFKVTISANKLIKEDGTTTTFTIGTATGNIRLLMENYDTKPISLAANEQTSNIRAKITIPPGAAAGIYVFDVTATQKNGGSWEPYTAATVQQIRISVG